MAIIDRWLFGLCLMAGPVIAQAAATFQIVNANADGTGFSDNAPANPVAGSNGTATLGAQRLRVIERAAEIWGTQLGSLVPIRVSVQMVEQPCGAEGTTLASAGPVDLAFNFPNAPRVDTAYHIAQANALAGRDLVPERDDITANFNIAVDAGCSANAVGWWYGIDPMVPVPSDRIALLPVALHELAHGLGFSAQVNPATGRYHASSPTVWSNYLYDLQLMKHWRVMTPDERARSARNDPHLVWSGSATSRFSNYYLRGAPALIMEAARGTPDDITDLGLAQFGARYPDAPLSGRVVLANDGRVGAGDVTGTPNDGCEFPFLNGVRLDGKIALIDRGYCPFVDKVRHAQSHGAAAVVIVNNEDGASPGMAGADPSITIPVVSVSRAVGARMKRSLLRPQLVISLGHTEGLAGVAQGCLRMYAPADVEAGSSVSHFHPSAFPDVLMEPSISRDLFYQVDLTSQLLGDIGWPLSFAIDPPPPNQCIVGPLP